MIAAVTGGTGFVGRALLARLVRAPEISEIRVLSRRDRPDAHADARVRWIAGDLSEAGKHLGELLERADTVFHCAGEIRREARMRALHVDATERLVRRAAGHVTVWVQLSSVGVYGRRRADAVEESSPAAPRGEYETTKAQADGLVADAASKGAFRHVILRPSIVFGPGMPNRSLYRLVSAIDRGWFAFIGREGAIANYVYVDDVADALAACALSSGAEGVYNLSDDRTLADFTGTIAKALGRPAPGRRLPETPVRLLARALGRVPGFPLTESRVDALTGRVRYPSTRIRRDLGYAFGVSIESGLERFVEDWRQQ